MKIRYVVKHISETPRSKRMVWRVYDTERASFPISFNGFSLKEHYTDPAVAQAEADKLNEHVSK